MRTGQIIDERYEIIRHIGSGGMANVYLAYDPILERQVAIKFLSLGNNNQSDAVRRFEREALSISELNHPNIVAIYDIGEDIEGKFIVMEYVEGIDLKEYIKQNHPIPLHEIQHIMLQIISGMQTAHEVGIIHRDLKPQNIMVKPDDTVIIMDFGIAVVSTETAITQTNTIIGSVHYLSPEQARGSLATNQSDIYSLGIVLYEMITGRVPFDGESAVSIALKHFQEPLPDISTYREDASQPLINVVKKATAKDAKDRYDDCNEMYDDLATVFDEKRQSEPEFIPMGMQHATIAMAKDEIEEKLKYTDEYQAMAAGKERDAKSEEETQVTPVAPIPMKETIAEAAEVEPEEEKPLKEGIHISDTPAEKKRKRKKWIMILLPLLIVLLVVGAFLFNRSRQVDLPDLRNMTQREAELTLQQAGLTVGDVEEVFSDDVDDGRIVDTNPHPNSKTRKNAEIDLELSKGPEPYQIKDYTGKEYKNAQKELADKGFTVEKVEEYSDSVPEGQIIAQSIAPEEEVIPKESTMTFTVSLGVERFTMPDLSDLNRAGIEQWAANAGVTVSFSEENNDSVPQGGVLSQSINAGDTFIVGDKLNVVLSSGPKTTTFNKSIQIEYKEPENNDEDTNDDEDDESESSSSSSQSKENTIEIFVQDLNNDYSSPVDTFTISKNREYNLEFTTREGDSARYKVVRDGEVIDETQVSE